MRSGQGWDIAPYNNSPLENIAKNQILKNISVFRRQTRHTWASCAMLRPMRSNSPYHTWASRSAPAPVGAADFLRGNGPMAALMPAVTRMMALQTDCASALPAMYSTCDIIQFEGGQLVLATPNAALAAKLKQQLPKLQNELIKRGWQIDAIRLKVKMAKSLAPIERMRQLELPEMAVSAMAALSDALPASPSNQDLIAALRALVRRRRG